MQHPDEGMIHSWLDGVLPAEEAAGLESHVATCQSCAATVAEARGFIAASSRILTALDDVPRGVIPAVPHQKRGLGIFWRAAAAMLVVAGGSLVVIREGGQDARLSKSGTEPTTVRAPVLTQPEAAEATITGTAATGVAGRAADRATVDRVDESAASQRIATASPVGKGTAANERDLSLRTERRSRDETSAAQAMRAGTPPPAGEMPPLKALTVERAIGSRRTTYEVAPSQTVILTEYLPLQLEAVVVAEPMRVEAAPTAPPPPPLMRDSRSIVDAASIASQAAVAKTSVGQVQSGAAFVTAANTISWKDAATGNTLTLSGRLTVDRLQEIRRQIEKERESARRIP